MTGTVNRALLVRGGGRMKQSIHITLTMVAGATTADTSFTPIPGSRITSIKAVNPTAFTGTPTNINLTVGKTAGGTEYVAATDIKAASITSLTLATSNLADLLSWPVSQAVGLQIAAVGGTSPAGAVTVVIDFDAPNP